MDGKWNYKQWKKHKIVHLWSFLFRISLLSLFAANWIKRMERINLLICGFFNSFPLFSAVFLEYFHQIYSSDSTIFFIAQIWANVEIKIHFIDRIKIFHCCCEQSLILICRCVIRTKWFSAIFDCKQPDETKSLLVDDLQDIKWNEMKSNTICHFGLHCCAKCVVLASQHCIKLSTRKLESFETFLWC